MAQFVVRNIEDGVKARLQRRARRNGRSMEEEVRDILRSAVNEADVAPGGL
jgi:plasmid stability protein